MKILTVNTTFKIPDEYLTEFENQLREVVEVIDLRIVPDTEKLYETDKTFQRLVKKEKEARSAKLEYINKFNLE